MNPFKYLSILYRELKQSSIERLLRYRIQYHNPTMYTHHTVLWNYGFNWLDSIEIGKNVHIMAGIEIVVFKKTRNSTKEGKLILKDNSVIATGANIRAAGGIIELGEYSGIGENTVVVAVNHSISKDHLHLDSPWDEDRTDVIIGRNVWIGANSCLLPGCRIGDNSIVGAGSVVTGEIPADEIWAGVPARKIRDL